LLYTYVVPVPPNLYSSALINIGEMKSSGLELALNYEVVKKTDFSYNILFTGSHNLNNKLGSVSGNYNGTALKYGYWEKGSLGSPGSSLPGFVRTQEDQQIGQLIAYRFKEIDKNGNLILEDVTKDGRIDMNDRVVVGNGLPNFLIGLGNAFRYKNWDLDIFFRGDFGHNLVNTYRAMFENPRNISYYNVPKTAVALRNPVSGTLINYSAGAFTDRFVENASFLALDNFSLGYNFSLAAHSPFSKIRVYLAGNNLFYLTGYQGSDPNPRYADNLYSIDPLVPGIDQRNTWPRTRSLTFGVNVVF
jgi:iron complex outermembrane receptor protein